LSITKHRRVTAYPSPLNFKKLKEIAGAQKVSTSKIVNQALTAFFKDKKSI
jgi:hypothetical protein